MKFLNCSPDYFFENLICAPTCDSSNFVMQEERRERLMMELEHAKLMAKIAKKKKERAIQASAPPPPPCTVIPEPVDPSCPLASISIEDLKKACLAKGLDSSGTRAAITARLKASNAKKPAPATLRDPAQNQSASKPVADPWASLNINQLQVECLKVGLPSKGSREALIQRLRQSGNIGKQLNINGPSPSVPGAHMRLGPGNRVSAPPPPDEVSRPPHVIGLKLGDFAALSYPLFSLSCL